MSAAGDRDPGQSLPVQGPGSRKRRRWFLAVSGVLLGIVVAVFREVLLPFLLGLVLAYVLSPLVSLGQQLRFGRWHPPRWLVVLTLYITLIGLSVGLVSFSVPRLAAETARLSKEAPRTVASLRQQWLPELDRRLREATETYLPGGGRAEPEPEAAKLPGPSGAAAPRAPAGPTPAFEVRPRANGGYEVILPSGGLRVVPDGRAFRIEPASPHAKGRVDIAAAVTAAVAQSMNNTEQTGVTVLQTAQQVVTRLVRGIFAFLLTIVVSAYLLITSGRIFEFARSLYAPGRRGDFDELVRRIDRGLSGVVRGQLIICAINGVLSGIGFYYVFHLKYWTFLTIVAAVMSIIPIFGSILSSIPAVMVGLSQDVTVALGVLAWIVGIHQLEAHVLNPKIMGDSARVHPVLVVFALVAGEHAAGILGALLAVPVLSITQTLFLYLRERFLGVPRNSAPPPAPTQIEERASPATSSSADPSRAG